MSWCKSSVCIEGRLTINTGAATWDWIYNLAGTVYAALLFTGVSLSTPPICIIVMSGLQAATNNGGHHMKVDGPGEDLPCCHISVSTEGPQDNRRLGMAGFLGPFSPNTSVKETLLGNESVHGIYHFPGTSFPQSY